MGYVELDMQAVCGLVVVIASIVGLLFFLMIAFFLFEKRRRYEIKLTMQKDRARRKDEASIEREKWIDTVETLEAANKDLKFQLLMANRRINVLNELLAQSERLRR